MMILMLMLSLAGGTTTVYSQSWGEKLIKNAGKRAEERAKQKVEEKVNKAVDKAVDKPFEVAEDAVKGTGKDAGAKPAEAAAQARQEGQPAVNPNAPKAVEMAWNKFDFVAGDEVIFDDQQAGEKIGEFPTMWDLTGGNAEIANMDGTNCICLVSDTYIQPYMKEKNYLPDVFTIELDVFAACGQQHKVQVNDSYWLSLKDANERNVFEIHWYLSYHDQKPNYATGVDWHWKVDGENRSGEQPFVFKQNEFNRISISFNKRALKVYLNETRVVNIPRCDAPARFQVYGRASGTESKFIRNIRIAKGAVPLYDRMMSDGKFITYGITFDVGKSVVKPESMGEINRIVTLMTENPDLKFSVEGHTDSTGNAASNQTLSEARSKAIVAKLVEMGIAADRLAAVGKGQNNPIADNATDEGRAKNRRVEFVKQ